MVLEFGWRSGEDDGSRIWMAEAPGCWWCGSCECTHDLVGSKRALVGLFGCNEPFEFTGQGDDDACCQLKL
jgi:hypothetical protein